MIIHKWDKRGWHNSLIDAIEHHTNNGQGPELLTVVPTEYISYGGIQEIEKALIITK